MCSLHCYWLQGKEGDRELQHFFAGCGVEGLPALTNGMFVTFGR
jgi:hypothetical protein